jgi:hypothetical protein
MLDLWSIRSLDAGRDCFLTPVPLGSPNWDKKFEAEKSNWSFLPLLPKVFLGRGLKAEFQESKESGFVPADDF